MVIRSRSPTRKGWAKAGISIRSFWYFPRGMSRASRRRSVCTGRSTVDAFVSSLR